MQYNYLEDQKYFLIVNEDTHGVEKVFKGDISELSEYEDYIIIDVGSGTTPTAEPIAEGEDTYCQTEELEDAKYIIQPEMSAITNLRGIQFLAKSFLRGSMGLGENITVLYSKMSKNIKSFTEYVGTYKNKEVCNTGFQINEFNLEFNREGSIRPTITGYARLDELRDLKDESELPFIAKPVRFHDLKEVEIREYDEAGMDLDEGWDKLGCDVTIATANYSNDINEDSGFKVCGGRFSSGYDASSKKPVTAELTFTQDGSIWRERFYGHEGYTKYVKTNFYSLRFTIQTQDGRTLYLILPKTRMTLETGSLEKDAEEKVTFTASRGLFQLDDVGVKKITSNYILMFDDTSLEIGYGEIEYTNDTEETQTLHVMHDLGEGKEKYAINQRVLPSKTYSAPLEWGNYKAYIDGEEIDSFSLSGSEPYIISPSS